MILFYIIVGLFFLELLYIQFCLRRISKNIYQVQVTMSEILQKPPPPESQGIIDAVIKVKKKFDDSKKKKIQQTYNEVMLKGVVTDKEKNLIGVEKGLF